MRLTFTDTVFEITELDFAVLDRGTLSPDLLAALELPGSVNETPNVKNAASAHAAGPVSLTGPDLSDVELGVEFRLHQIGADLSEPIEVNKGKNQIVIRAVGASEERKRQLIDTFANDPNVRLELEKVSPPEGSISVPISISGSGTSAELDKKLMEFLGGAAAEESFARAVLASDASILARLYALRHLAERWPPGAEAGLSPDSRLQLRTMVNNHGSTLNTALPELKHRLAPLLQEFCGAASLSPRAATWQESSNNGLQAARTLDRLLRALLTTSASSITIEKACPDLSTALSSLESAAAGLLPEP